MVQARRVGRACLDMSDKMTPISYFCKRNWVHLFLGHCGLILQLAPYNWVKFGGPMSPSGHHPTTLSGYIFATKAYIDNRNKVVKQQYLFYMSSQYGELRPTSGWDRFASLGHASKFQRVSRLGSVTARHCSSERQPNFAALNRGRHLYSAGRPSRLAFAHILV